MASSYSHSPHILTFLLVTLSATATAVSSNSRRAVLATATAGGGKKKDTHVTNDNEYCESWRFSVETNNIGPYSTVPSQCVTYVKTYMNGGRYASDAESEAYDALTFAKNVSLGSDGKDAWVFDIDDTLLSNLPYYAKHGYGSEVYNSTSNNEWTEQGAMPVISPNLKLYNELNKLGFKLFLLTGRSEKYRAITKKNLINAGYRNWEKLILRGTGEESTNAIVYKPSKRAEIVKQGYTIHGSCGDQWSDLLGHTKATRSFKVPNPMYYIP